MPVYFLFGMGSVIEYLARICCVFTNDQAPRLLPPADCSPVPICIVCLYASLLVATVHKNDENHNGLDPELVVT